MTDGSGSRPVFYYLYGDNLFGIEQTVRGMRRQLSEQADATLNHDRFDASTLSFSTLRDTATSIPFLGQRRLVEVHNAEQLLRLAEHRQALLELVNGLPDTTALVLLHQVDLSRRNALGKFQSKSDLIAWVKANPTRGFERAFRLPQGPAFDQWLIGHFEEMGGTIAPQAARLLAEYVNGDPYLAHQEARKLLNYTDQARTVTREDVELLTPFYSQGDVFAMVDALGQRDLKAALGHLQRLLEHENPRYAFAMIVRQFRLILIARSAIDQGQDPAQVLDVHPFVAGKVTAQARNFSAGQLRSAYRRLFLLDVDSKSGGADLDRALDRLLVDLTE